MMNVKIGQFLYSVSELPMYSKVLSVIGNRASGASVLAIAKDASILKDFGRNEERAQVKVNVAVSNLRSRGVIVPVRGKYGEVLRIADLASAKALIEEATKVSDKLAARTVQAAESVNDSNSNKKVNKMASTKTVKVPRTWLNPETNAVEVFGIGRPSKMKLAFECDATGKFLNPEAAAAIKQNGGKSDDKLTKAELLAVVADLRKQIAEVTEQRDQLAEIVAAESDVSGDEDSDELTAEERDELELDAELHRGLLGLARGHGAIHLLHRRRRRVIEIAPDDRDRLRSAFEFMHEIAQLRAVARHAAVIAQALRPDKRVRPAVAEAHRNRLAIELRHFFQFIECIDHVVFALLDHRQARLRTRLGAIVAAGQRPRHRAPEQIRCRHQIPCRAEFVGDAAYIAINAVHGGRQHDGRHFARDIRCNDITIEVLAFDGTNLDVFLLHGYLPVTWSVAWKGWSILRHPHPLAAQPRRSPAPCDKLATVRKKAHIDNLLNPSVLVSTHDFI